MKIGCVTHVYQERLMLPAWIEWHKQFFDFVTIIDDGGATEFQHLLPEGWKIIPTRRTNFNCFELDKEVMEVEAALKAEHNPDWIVTLNISEWIFEPDFKQKIEELSRVDIEALGMYSIVLVDNDNEYDKFYSFSAPRGFNSTVSPLFHTTGFIDLNQIVRRRRYIHNQPQGEYELGRHNIRLRSYSRTDMLLLILHWSHAPWPACIDRKLQIQDRIPQEHKNMRLGYEHLVTLEELNEKRLELLKMSVNLIDNPMYRERYDRFYPTIYCI